MQNWVIFVCTMSAKSPSVSSDEVSVEVHPVPGEKSHKRQKRNTDKDGTEVITDSRTVYRNSKAIQYTTEYIAGTRLIRTLRGHVKVFVLSGCPY